MAKKKLRKPNAVFLKPVVPSKSLAKIVGSQPRPRTEVTKLLWEYIKKHKLQDKVDRKMINADKPLKIVFKGRSHVSMFEMSKFVSKNLASKAIAAKSSVAGAFDSKSARKSRGSRLTLTKDHGGDPGE